MIKTVMVSSTAPGTMVDPNFKPFHRADRYGTAGKAALPLQEHLRLALCLIFIAPIKLVIATSALVSFWLICHASALLPPRPRNALIVCMGKFHSRLCLLGLGFVSIRHTRVHPPGYPTNPNARPGGIISNHAGYSDILAAMWLFFPSFVARKSTRHIPLIGIISYLMGCLYVDRERVNNSHSTGIALHVKERMLHTASGKDPLARPLLLFPEGTTTNNRYMLPFRTGAFLAGVPVQPIILKYSQTEPLSMSWESISIQRHMLLALANPTHSLTVYELPVYVPSAVERDDPKLYAANVRAYMIKCGDFVPSDATFTDKQRFLHLVGVSQDKGAIVGNKPKRQ